MIGWNHRQDVRNNSRMVIGTSWEYGADVGVGVVHQSGRPVVATYQHPHRWVGCFPSFHKTCMREARVYIGSRSRVTCPITTVFHPHRGWVNGMCFKSAGRSSGFHDWPLLVIVLTTFSLPPVATCWVPYIWLSYHQMMNHRPLSPTAFGFQIWPCRIWHLAGVEISFAFLASAIFFSLSNPLVSL